MQDPVPQSVAVGEIANSAVDDDSGPPTVLPLASSDVVDPSGLPPDDGRIEPSLGKTNSVFPDEDLPPPTESGTPKPEGGANPRGWYSPPIGRGITWSGRFAGLATCCSRYWRWPWLRWPSGVPEWYREEIESRAQEVGGQALRIESLGVGWQRGPYHAQGVSFADDPSVRIAGVGVAPDWYGVAARGRLSTPQHRRAARTSLGLAALACAAGSGSLNDRPHRLRRPEGGSCRGPCASVAGRGERLRRLPGELRLRDASGLLRIEVNGLDSMPLKVSMAASSWASPFAGQAPLRAGADGWELQDDHLRLTEMRAAAHGGRYSGSGTLYWNPSPRFDGTLWLDGVQLERLLLAVMPDAQAQGVSRDASSWSVLPQR